jgi:signal transduction histidine kinase
MTNQDRRVKHALESRRQAVEIALERAAQSPEAQVPEAPSPEDTQKTLHELQVHQIELEMQNQELRLAQAELDAARARYLDLYDLAPVGYVTLSDQGLILEANLTVATLLGVSRGALVTQPFSSFVLADDQDIYYLRSKGLLETSSADSPDAPQAGSGRAGQSQAWELRMVKADGTTFWARLEGSVAHDPLALRPDSAQASADQAADGALVCRVVLSDISESKRADEDRERLQAQLTQAQKLESVGRLAGGVAHDFNNMLGVILGHAEMALELVDPSQPIHADLAGIHDAASRSADIARQLLAFARKQTITPRVLDLNDTLAGMMPMLHRLLGEDIQLAWQPTIGLWPVRMDPSHVDQIMVNLCVNARDAIADVGTVTIDTANAVFDEADCIDHPGFVPGGYVRIAVSDNGCGMDKPTMAHVFEPFFTTKDVGKGTGLGLATVYGAVKQNNGFINVYSEPGQGTTFSIYLTRHEGKAEQLGKDGTPQPAANGHETVLLVEDEPAVLQLGRMMMERLGYTVIGAGTPGEAIRLAEEHAGPIHLLMTDVVMPKMNGRDLARRVLSIYPDIKRLSCRATPQTSSPTMVCWMRGSISSRSPSRERLSPPNCARHWIADQR